MNIELYGLNDLVRLVVNLRDSMNLDTFLPIYFLRKNNECVFYVEINPCYSLYSVRFFTRSKKEPPKRYIEYRLGRKEAIRYVNYDERKNPKAHYIGIYEVLAEKNIGLTHSDYITGDESVVFEWIELEGFEEVIRIATDFLLAIFILKRGDEFLYFVGFPHPYFTVCLDDKMLGFFLYAFGPKPVLRDRLARYASYDYQNSTVMFFHGRDEWTKAAPLVKVLNIPSIENI
ncbi:MAG: hypothetical protein ACTSX9_07300 [Candidatus Njordarchaeales archaeon]